MIFTRRTDTSHWYRTDRCVRLTRIAFAHQKVDMPAVRHIERAPRPVPRGGDPETGVRHLADADVPTEDATEIEVKTVVKPVQNAIAILRHLTDEREGKTVTQVARAIGINTSTCYNILRTLAGETIVNFDAQRKTYEIGLGIMKIAAGAISEEARLAAARPLAHEYAVEHNATVCIWRRLTVERNVLIATEHPDTPLRIHMEVGQRLPVLLGSTGRAMAAHLGLSVGALRKEFKKLRWHNPPSIEDYLRDIEEARATGWAADDGNYSAGVLSISTPVISATGAINYTLTAITFRDSQAHKKAVLGEDLVGLARELASVLY
jgi:DNA-binding IclR family transcriptional regulator